MALGLPGMEGLTTLIVVFVTIGEESLLLEALMKPYSLLICCVLPLVCLSACKKSGSTQDTSATKPTVSTSAVPIATTPVAPGVVPAPAATASAVVQGGATAETTAVLAAAAWALKQDEIKNDPNGQWAIQATASSTYEDAQGRAGYSANQATGVPDVESYGDNEASWTSKMPDGGIEWLDLKFAKPVFATEVRVRESSGSGVVV